MQTMSSTSKNQSSAYLILDFGIYSSSKTLFSFLEKNNKNQIIELNPNQMNAADWDHVLGLIIKNKKCIAL